MFLILFFRRNTAVDLFKVTKAGLFRPVWQDYFLSGWTRDGIKIIGNPWNPENNSGITPSAIA